MKLSSLAGRLLMGLVILLLAVAFADEEDVEITWDASDPGEGIQDSYPSGLAKLKLEADDTFYTLTLFKVRGLSPDDDDIDAVEAADEAVTTAFSSGATDVTTLLNNALEIAEVHGEIGADAGDEDEISVILEDGTWILAGHAQGADGVPYAFEYETFVVEGKSVGVRPRTEQVIEMVDFDFVMPEGIQAGKQLWEVANQGEQLHHMVLIRLDDGKTMNDVMTFLETGEGVPPGDEAGYVGLLSKGQSAFVELDLEPGEYVAICFIPDHGASASTTDHAHLGMVQSFTVAGGGVASTE